MAKPRDPYKREVFIREYLTDRNASRAAKVAGYGGTKRSQQQAGADMLKDPVVQRRLAEHTAAVVEKLDLKGDTYLRQLHELCTFDPADFYDERGNALQIHQVPKHARMAIKSMQTIIKNAKAGDGAVDEVLAYQFIDRKQPLELMMKHLGLLVEKREVGKPGAFSKLPPDEKHKKLVELLAGLDYDVKPRPASKPH